MDHKELVKRAVSWLKNNQRCTMQVCHKIKYKTAHGMLTRSEGAKG